MTEDPELTDQTRERGTDSGREGGTDSGREGGSDPADVPDLTETERAALDELQHAVEHLHRACGAVVAFHHNVGHAMDYLEEARDDLDAAGHAESAAVLRDDILPAGVIDDHWTYEIVRSFREGMLADVTAFDAAVRDDLAGGATYLDEHDLQRRWRERADGWRFDGRTRE